MDRKVRKDAFYYYQAAWTDAPMIHLTGKRYMNRSYPVMDVKAYSNAPAARLTFNGRDMGEVRCPNHSCVWQGVALRPGANEAVVSASVEGQSVSDTATWNGIDPRSDGVRIDAGNLAASVVGGRRFGSDTFVTGGKPVPRYAGRIGASSTGADVPVAAALRELFDYWRSGDDFAYAIPLPDGDWQVTIHTLEPGEQAIDPRAAAMPGMAGDKYRPTVMAVSANGSTVIDRLDVAKAAGGARKGLARSFPVRVENGLLRLRFTGVAGGQATLAAIEILQ